MARSPTWRAKARATNTFKDKRGRKKLNFAVPFSFDHLSWQGKNTGKQSKARAECVAGEGVHGAGRLPFVRHPQAWAPRGQRELRVGEACHPAEELVALSVSGRQDLAGRGRVGAWGPEGEDVRVTEMVGDCLTFRKDSPGAFS